MGTAGGSNHVVIVGAGFAGIGMAIRLKRAGIEDFTLLERADRVGGTWRDNHYPGAACDVESHLYSFSFEPNPDWTRTFAPQKEILGYLERCVASNRLEPHLRLGEGVTAARYDEAAAQWSVETSKGRSIAARVLVAGCGPLNRPAFPDIPGLASFEGQAFHSSQWDPSASLDGARVGVIGTGASAIQIVPQLAGRASRLTVFQRTPPWILPKPDHAIPPPERERFRAEPWRQELQRRKQFWTHELTTLAFVSGKDSPLLRMGEKVARRHMERHVRAPELRSRLRPTFAMGCKRVLLSNDYYPAIARDHVEVVTDGIEQITPTGARTRDGRTFALDALVLATGFQAAEALAPFTTQGRGGRDLDTVWQGCPEAYLGTAVHGFPNLFLIIGPNTGLGASSMILMIEAQLAFILDAVQTMRSSRLASVEVKEDAQRQFNEKLQKRLSHTIWASGCKAWYTTRTGRNTTLWPGPTLEFRMKTRRFPREAFDLRRSAP